MCCEFVFLYYSQKCIYSAVNDAHGMHEQVMLFGVLFINSTSLDTSSAESSGTTVACSEMPEHNHSRGGGLVLPSSSHRSKCSNKPHRRALVTGLQWVGGWGCCFGGCHKVNVVKNCMVMMIVDVCLCE